MANCSTCGTSTGIIGPKECASCRDKREAQESATSERQRAAEVAEARQELLAIRQEIFDDEYEQVAATVAGGADAFLYRSVYVAVDSIHDEQEIADQFDIEPVRLLGRMGWEAVSVVPRTLGTSLQNISIGASSEKHTAVGSAARLSAFMFCSGTGLRWRTCRPRSASWLAAADSTTSPRRGCRLRPDVSRVAPKRGVGRRSGHVEGARMGQVRFHARRFDLGLRARIQRPTCPDFPNLASPLPGRHGGVTLAPCRSSTPAPGCPYRGLAIGSRGNPASRIVLVGEAPGANEMDEGMPSSAQPAQRCCGPLWPRRTSTMRTSTSSTRLRAVRTTQLIRLSAPRRPAPPRLPPTVRRRDRTHPRAVIVALGGTAVRALTGRRAYPVTKTKPGTELPASGVLSSRRFTRPMSSVEDSVDLRCSGWLRDSGVRGNLPRSNRVGRADEWFQSFPPSGCDSRLAGGRLLGGSLPAPARPGGRADREARRTDRPRFCPRHPPVPGFGRISPGAAVGVRGLGGPRGWGRRDPRFYVGPPLGSPPRVGRPDAGTNPSRRRGVQGARAGRRRPAGRAPRGEPAARLGRRAARPCTGGGARGSAQTPCRR